MTTIRLATDADAPRLLAFLVQLAGESAYTRGVPVNRDHLGRMLDRGLANPEAGFLVAEHDSAVIGLFVLLLFDHLISGERRAAQVCWYVDPAWRRGLGRHLFAHGEAWAGAHGAMRMQMLAPEAKFEAFYRRRGYLPTDRVFERSLVCLG